MKRNLLTILFAVIIASQLAIFAAPQPAHAQFGGVVSDIWNTAVNAGSKVADAAKWTYEKSSKALEAAWRKGGSIAYRNGLNYFLGQMARDAAIRVSGGCSGQEPCFQMNKEYWGNLGDAAVGDFLDTLAQEGGFLDNGLCEPFDPAVKLQLNLAVGQVSPFRDRPDHKPRCSFSQIRENIRELSLTDLVDVDLRIGRGSTIAEYSENLDTIIRRDTGIDQPVKERLLKTSQKLTSATENLTKYIEKAQTPGQEGADPAVLAEALANIMDAGVMLDKQNTVRTFDYHIFFPPTGGLLAYYTELYTRNKSNFCPTSDGSAGDPCAVGAQKDSDFYKGLLRYREQIFKETNHYINDQAYKDDLAASSKEIDNSQAYYFVDQLTAFKNLAVYNESAAGPPIFPYPFVLNQNRSFAAPDPEPGDPIPLLDSKFPDDAQFCTDSDLEAINTDNLIRGGGTDSFLDSDYNEKTIQQMLPGDAVGADVSEVEDVLVTMLDGSNKYNPAPMTDGSAYQQAAANLNAQFEELVIAQFYFVKIDNLSRFQDPPFDSNDLATLDDLYDSVVPNIITLAQDFESYYDALDTVAGTNGSGIEPALNRLKGKIRNTKDTVKDLGKKIQSAYQRYDEDRGVLAIIGDFAFDGEIDGSEADSARAEGILPYLEAVIPMYEALKKMDNDLRDFDEVFDGAATGGGAGGADEYAFASCRERTQEYLTRLDAWYKTLYQEAAKVNDARRANAFDRISSSEDLADIGKVFNQESNPFGAYLALDSAANQDAAKKVEESKFFDSINGAFKGVASTVSGVIKTPAPLVEETGKQPIKSAADQYSTFTGEAVADAVGIFTNTLMSQMLKNWFEGPGVNPSIAERGVAGRGIPVTSGIKVARKLFSKLGALKPKTVEDADVLTLLSTSVANQPPIINSGFKTAIEQQLTLREALSEEYGLLDPNAVFGYKSSNVEPSIDEGIPYRSMVLLRHYRIIPVGWELAAQYINEKGTRQTLGALIAKFDDPGQWSNEFPLSNIAEIKDNDDKITGYSFTSPDGVDAEQFYEDGQIEFYSNENIQARCHSKISVNITTLRVTTKDEVICLNIDQDKLLVLPSISSGKVRVLYQDNPYYGLVNPDWVLKAPQLKCNAEGPGEIVIRRQEVSNPDDPNGPKVVQITRSNSCADEQTCVYEKENGQCRFGYCTKEKFVWKFEDNQECRPEYNSCELFTDSKGNSSYYLKSTLDTEGCSADNVGCREYLRVADPEAQIKTPQITTAIEIKPETNITTPLLSTASLRVPGTGTFWCTIAGGARCEIKGGDTSCDIEGPFGFVEICSLLGDRTAVAHLNAKAVQKATEVGCNSASASCQRYLRVNPVRQDQSSASRFWNLPDIESINKLIVDSVTDNPNDVPNITLADFRIANLQEKFLNSKRSICENGPRAIGCQAFTPVDGNSEVTVFAKLETTDQCPASCNGYNDYIESPTLFDSGFKTKSFVVYDVTGGESCSAASVGCEEFTNVNAQSLGTSESKEYYTQVRWCANDAQVTQSGDNFKKRYFVWEGVDIFGFQLRAVDLLRSNSGQDQPCTNPILGSGNTTLCNDAVSDLSLTTCSAALASENPDCREYIDAEGDSHFVFQSKTIPVTNECRLIRRTAGAGELYNILASSSSSCSASENMCRRYEGPQAGNVRVIFSSDFGVEDINRGLWAGDVELKPADAAGIEYLTVTNGVQDANFHLGFSDSIDVGREYSLSFVYRVQSGSGILSVPLGAQEKDGAESSTLVADGEWHTATIGGIKYAGSPKLFEMHLNEGLESIDIDSIALTTQVDVFYRKKNTIQEPPAICTNFQGCSAYSTKIAGTDEEETIYNYKFSSPCEASDVGCEALINTNNTNEVGEKIVYNKEGEELLTIPQDFVEIVRVVEEAACGSEKMGCSLVSLPIVNSENKLSGFEPVYILDNPSAPDYTKTMCEAGGVMCEAFSIGVETAPSISGDGNTRWFKDPQGRVCSFSDGKWKRTLENGTVVDCPTKMINTFGNSGNPYEVPLSGYVGACAAEFRGCTELKESKENKSLFIVGPIKPTGPACTSTDIKFGTCRYFDTLDAPLRPNENPTGMDYKTQILNGSKKELYRIRNDRTCGEWLECRSGTTVATVDESGNDTPKTVCLDFYACQNTEDGVTCTEPREPTAKTDFTYDQPTVKDFVSQYATDSEEAYSASRSLREFNEFNQLSGLSKAGLRFNDNYLIEGNFHPVNMSVVGESANVVNFNFERDLNGDNLPDGWYVQTDCQGSCSLENQEVKSGAYSLKIGSVSEQGKVFSDNRYSTNVTVADTESYRFTALVSPVGSVEEPQTVLFRYRTGARDSNAGIILEKEESFSTGGSARTIQHDILSVTGSNLSIDIITSDDFAIKDVVLEPAETRNLSFDDVAVGTTDFSTGLPVGLSSRVFKSFGCTNCSVAQRYNGQKVIQIGKTDANELVCTAGKTTLSPAAISHLGNVCTEDNATQDCGFELSGGCSRDTAQLTLRGSHFSDVTSTLTYTLQGVAYSPSSSSSSRPTTLPNLSQSMFEVHLSDSDNSGDAVYEDGLMWRPADANGSFKNVESFRYDDAETASGEGTKFRVSFNRSNGTGITANERYPYVTIKTANDQTVHLGNLTFFRGSNFLPDVSNWTEVSPYRQRTQGTATNRYIRVKGFESTLNVADLRNSGISMKVLNIRGNTDYVLSGWVNTKGLETSSIGNEVIYISQFDKPAPNTGRGEAAGAVGGLTSVQISNADDKWVFFTSEVFRTDPSAQSLRIDLLQNIQGFILYDDIQLRPVLRVASSHLRRDAGPTCRMYPADDAAQCDAVNAQGELIKGWRGYCMERDPANPAVCIQWYPVDVIKDESNTFAKPENVGYQGGGPVYHCAVAKEKEPLIAGKSFEFPRMICPTFRGSAGTDEAGCMRIGLVSDPKPAFYEMLTDDWRLGDSFRNSNAGASDLITRISVATTGDRRIGDDGDASKRGKSDGCFEVRGRESTDKRTNDITLSSTSGCLADDGPECYLQSLKEVYHKVVLYKWSDPDLRCDKSDNRDSGYAFDEAYCADPYCTQHDDSVFDNFSSLNYSPTQYVDRDDILYHFGSAEKQQRIPRPLYCSQIVQTVDHDGENAVWNSRLHGAYTGEEGSPIQFGSDTQCEPFSATPAIDSPSDILQLVDTNNDFVPDLTKRTPLLLYSPGDTQNNDKTQICKEVHRGNMAFAYNATITLCEGGTQEGSICFNDIDCAGGGSCGGNVSAQNDTFESGGVGRVLNVFARIFKVFNWDETLEKYDEKTDTYSIGDLDKRESCVPGVNCEAPIIDVVRVKGETEFVSVGSQQEDSVVVKGGNIKSVTLEFTTNIPQNHLPIRSIEIDWGDGESTRQTSLHIDQRRNVSNPHRYTHVYESNGEKIIRIRVTDNWGWCNKRNRADGVDNSPLINYGANCVDLFPFDRNGLDDPFDITGTGNDYRVTLVE